ncbi:MAG: DUF4252 domain-containing protein [Verrucomicrobiales bacterium]|nr:DUF4252 domain-containing protein [Verrucomicrobiales bacterium]
MNAFARFASGSLLAFACFANPIYADVPAPGLVDFGKFTPPSGGGQFVEINVKSGLIGLAARLAEKAEPEVAGLLRGLQAVRVNVIGIDDANRTELGERLAKIRSELEDKGWERIVTVQEKSQDVGVYVKHRGEESIEGVVVTVVEANKEAVLVNVVGDIRPEQLVTVGEKLGIEPLKKAAKAGTKA